MEKDETQVAYVGLDADLVAEQSGKKTPGGKQYLRIKRSNVVHWNGCVRWVTKDGVWKSYYLTSLNRIELFRQLLAFLIITGLIRRFLHFFVDGEQCLLDDLNQQEHHQ